MFTTLRGVIALRQLRMELQEDAGSNFPNDVHKELLVLYDVCKSLDLNIFQAREVLGETGWQSVTDYINSPACQSVDVEQAKQLLSADDK